MNEKTLELFAKKDNFITLSQPQIIEKIKAFPKQEGVYLMRDDKGLIIYVGKARNLHSRVASYFRSSAQTGKTLLLVRRVCDVEYIRTENEYDALILENNLIKQYYPRYNINLRDGKTYPVICISKEKFPRVFRTRHIKQDGSLYFGPYPNIKEIDILLNMIEKFFSLRKCREAPMRKRSKPCLYHHLKQCKAPCVDFISEKEYQQDVRQVKKLLSGKRADTIKELTKMIRKEAELCHFEVAAQLRDDLYALQGLQEQSSLVDFNQETRDYIATESDEQYCVFSVMKMREGQVVDRDLFCSRSLERVESTVENFIIQYYSKERQDSVRTQDPIPSLIFTDHLLPNLIVDYFEDVHQRKVKIQIPNVKKDRVILNMAKENALQELARLAHKSDKVPTLQLLQDYLNLDNLPLVIEGFDISHLGGKYTVASMIRFVDGRPEKRHYRYFAIKSLASGEIDDYQAIREAVTRRYTKLIDENLQLPHLLLIDGGKGQVNAAHDILSVLGIADVLPVIGLAKKHELIVFPDGRKDVDLQEGDPALKILQHLRDECHRFANKYVAGHREKEVAFQLLSNIAGIGEKRSEQLLKEYTSLEALSEASASDICAKTSLPETVAESLVNYLKHR